MKGETNRFTLDETRGQVAAESEEYAAVYDTLPLCKFIRRCFTGKADRLSNNNRKADQRHHRLELRL